MKIFYSNEAQSLPIEIRNHLDAMIQECFSTDDFVQFFKLEMDNHDPNYLIKIVQTTVDSKVKNTYVLNQKISKNIHINKLIVLRKKSKFVVLTEIEFLQNLLDSIKK